MLNDLYIPQPGDIGITRISGAGGLGIRIGQWLNGDGFADYEHAFVCTSPGTIVEAMPNGAREIMDWHKPSETVYLSCPPVYRTAVAEAAHSLVGTPYSFADYAALAAHRFHIPTPHLKRYIETSGHAICSQLADLAAQRGGWHLFSDGRWSGDVTPGDLFRLYLEQQLASTQS